MAFKSQLTGMRGVYLVAAELARRGFIVSPTSRSAHGVDLLVTNQALSKTFSVEVKTKKATSISWPLHSKVLEVKSKSHLYVLVNLLDALKKKSEEGPVEFFVIPSLFMSKTAKDWRPSWQVSIRKPEIKHLKDKWNLFGSVGE